MGAVVATAQRGRGAGGGLLARSAWRLLALLGLAFVAVVLFSATANADSCAGSTCHESAPAPEPGLVPGLLENADVLIHPVLSSVTRPDAQAVNPADAVTPVLAGAHDAGQSSPSDPAGSSRSAGDDLAPVMAVVASAVPKDARTPVDVVHSVGALTLHDSLTPVVTAATTVASGTADVLSDTTAPLPVLGFTTTLLRGVGRATTEAVASTVGSLTIRVDTGIASLTASGGDLLAPLTRGTRPLPAAGAGSTGAAGNGPSPTVVAESGAPALAVIAGPQQASSSNVSAPAGTTPGVESAPPESLGGASAVQSAPAAVPASAAPAFGAVGIAVGSAGSAVGGSAGVHDQTDEPRGVGFRTVMAVGRPGVTTVRPLPGTPLVDPGFSPD